MLFPKNVIIIFRYKRKSISKSNFTQEVLDRYWIDILISFSGGNSYKTAMESNIGAFYAPVIVPRIENSMQIE
jgi:hypothetical protein